MRELEGVKHRWGEGGWRKNRVGGKQEQGRGEVQTKSTYINN